jgi:hypothetical protein
MLCHALSILLGQGPELAFDAAIDLMARDALTDGRLGLPRRLGSQPGPTAALRVIPASTPPRTVVATSLRPPSAIALAEATTRTGSFALATVATGGGTTVATVRGAVAIPARALALRSAGSIVVSTTVVGAVAAA